MSTIDAFINQAHVRFDPIFINFEGRIQVFPLYICVLSVEEAEVRSLKECRIQLRDMETGKTYSKYSHGLFLKVMERSSSATLAIEAGIAREVEKHYCITGSFRRCRKILRRILARKELHWRGIARESLKTPFFKRENVVFPGKKGRSYRNAVKNYLERKKRVEMIDEVLGYE